MSERFIRSGYTRLAYAMLALYGYALNVLGPVTPFLRAELGLSYTVSGYHFSAFAAGIVGAGLFGGALLRAVGRRSALWAGAGGIACGAALLALGHRPSLTIGGALLMGTVGSAILVVVASSLSDEHGPLRVYALTEANVVASLVSALTGVVVGALARTPLGWRAALAAAVIAPPALFLTSRAVSVPQPARAAPARPRRRLRPLFWTYWCALVMAVSVEFCLVFWAADFLEEAVGLRRDESAASVSIFLAGMLLGRLAASRIVRRVPPATLVEASLALAAAAFLAYWRAPSPGWALPALLACGVGVASLYPMLLSLALAAAEDADLAAARATLASGVAILCLPLLLARLADAFGIRAAHGLVVAVLAAAWALARAARRMAGDSG